MLKSTLNTRAILPNSLRYVRSDVPKSYINMVDEQMSAILLLHEGMDGDYIVEDYMKSKENLQPMLKAYASQNPDVNVITPHERYMREFLAWLEKEVTT